MFAEVVERKGADVKSVGSEIDRYGEGGLVVADQLGHMTSSCAGLMFIVRNFDASTPSTAPLIVTLLALTACNQWISNCSDRFCR